VVNRIVALISDDAGSTIRFRFTANGIGEAPVIGLQITPPSARVEFARNRTTQRFTANLGIAIYQFYRGS
jgi:hypothetical protein